MCEYFFLKKTAINGRDGVEKMLFGLGRTSATTRCLDVDATLVETLQIEAAVVVVNGVSRHDLVDLGELLAVGLEGVFAQPAIVEEILDDDLSAVRAHGARLHGPGWIETSVEVVGAIGARTGARLGHDGEPRHVTDAGQCLAAKPERVYRAQIVERLQLGRGEAFAQDLEVVARYAAPVVRDVHELEAGVAYLHVYRRGARVQAVLDELFERVARPLDDLTRRDSIHQLRVERVDSSRRRR